MLVRIIKSVLLLVFVTSFSFCQTQKTKSKDGVDIAYIVKGEGEPALVFIHGWSCDKSYWANQIKAFSPEYKVVAIDLGGHGESGLNRENWTMESYGEDVAAVVNHLKLNKVILIGHSMGGAVILEAEKILKGKVIGLIGADTFQNLGETLPEDQAIQFVKSFQDNFIETTKAFVKTMFPQTADSNLVKKVAGDMSSAPPQVAVSAMLNMFKVDEKETLEKLDVPIISINCDMYPIQEEQNKKLVKSFELKIMKGVGHFVMLENPDEFNKLLGEGVDELIKDK